MLTILPTRISHGYLIAKTGPPLCPSYNLHIIMIFDNKMHFRPMPEMNFTLV